MSQERDATGAALAARGESPAAFGRRCIPADCVAPPSNIPDILGRRALSAGRLAALGATPDFHHGLLAAQDPSYLRDVRPILDKSCTSCHQPASKQSDLDLTTFDRFQAGGTRGPAFVPGSPEQSLVLQFITAALQPSMPFGQPPLAEGDVATIRDWIKSGARDDSPSDPASS